jgi:hypothetical protein
MKSANSVANRRPRPFGMLIEIPIFHDPSGDLGFMEEESHIPFPIKRFFHINGITANANRGGHAHKDCHQFLLALAGSFDIIIDDSWTRTTFRMDSARCGLHVPPGLWVDITNFSDGAAIGALASHLFSKSDYIRDYESYKKYAKSRYK